MWSFRRVAGVIATLVSVGGPAEATDLAQPKLPQKDTPNLASPWQFQFTPYAWLIFVTGDQQLGSTTSHIDTNIFDILDKSDHLYAWMSYQELRNGPLSLYTDVVWSRTRFSDTKSGVFPIGPLNRSNLNLVVNSKIWLNMAIIESGATLEIAKWSSGVRSPNGGFVPTTAIDLVGGARYWFIQPEVDLNVTATVSIPALGLSRTGSGSLSAEKTIDWWDPLVGLRVRHQPAPDQELVIKGDVGGFDVGSKFTWQVLGTYSFATKVAGLNFTSYLGYRALSIDYQQDAGDKKIGLDFLIHGPVVGLAFKW